VKTSEKAHAALKKLEELWKDPERLTGTLSAILLVSPTGRPIDRWSIRNRILCAIEGTNDARTFNQWKEADRSVKKGKKAVYILAPITVKDEDEAEKVRLIGFRCVPVFRLEDTEGEPVETMNTPPPPPLADVAEAWNLPINYAPHDGKYYGFYNKTRPSITLMVENPSVYFHELMHAADDLLHGIHGGQDADQEAIAEIGSAVLARLYDQPTDKHAYDYVNLYTDPIKAMNRLLPRIETCLTAILETTHEEALILQEVV